MSSIFCFVTAIFLLAQMICTNPGSLDLTKQLQTILTQPGFSESLEVATILQNLKKLTNNTDKASSAFLESHGTSTDLDGACKVGQLLLGQTSFLDTSSVGYVNATNENWYFFP